MKAPSIVASLMLSGFVFAGSAQAADKGPCVSSPEPPPATGATGATGPVVADPGPCKVQKDSTKKSKGGKGSNNGKAPDHSNAGGNGNGNGNGNAGGNGGGSDDNSEESKIKRGLEIAPVALDLQGRNRALVALGSYIVNAQGGCNDCHTYPAFAPGGDPYKGEPKMINAVNYLAGGRPFGPITSPNLTPDPQSALTEAQRYADFLKIMRTGIDPATGKYLQVMPWPVYQDMTDRDLQAVFEYLQAIPPAKPAAP
jgi:hypothetical protein